MQTRRRSGVCRDLVLLSACFLSLFLFFFPPAHAETGVSDTRILLGQSAGLSGPSTYLSRQVMLGARVYFDKINQQGGIHGRRIDLITRDDKYSASQAAYNTRQFIDNDKVFALFGYVGWPIADAAIPIAAKEHVPFFAPISGGASHYKPFNRYVFTVRASYIDEYSYFLRQLPGLGMRKAVLVYQQNHYGAMMMQEVEELAKKQGVVLNSIDVDFNGQNLPLDKIFSAQADVVMLVTSNYKTNAAIVRGLRERGYLGQFFCVSLIGQKVLADELGDTSRGILVTQAMPLPWRMSMPLVAEYRKHMAEAGYNEFTFGSLEGYLAARVLTEGLRRARRELTREKLIHALETINPRNYDGGGYAINFSPTNHNGSMYVDIAAMTKDGRFLN